MPKHWSAFTLKILAANPPDVSFIIIFFYLIARSNLFYRYWRRFIGVARWTWPWYRLAWLTRSATSRQSWPKSPHKSEYAVKKASGRPRAVLAANAFVRTKSICFFINGLTSVRHLGASVRFDTAIE